MKRPVTSLCRRPGKKTACRAACPRCRNNFRPQGRSAAGRQICRAKAAWMRAQKQPRRGPGTVCRLRPRGNSGQWEVSGAVKRPPGLPARTEDIPGAKTAPSGGPGLCAGCAHGGTAGNEVSGAGKHHTGLPAGTEGTPGRKNSPGRGWELCAGCAHGRAAGDGGIWCREASHWTPTGAESTPGRKNSLRRGPEAVWMRDMGVTCPGRSV